MQKHIATRTLWTVFILLTFTGCAELDRHIETIKPTARLVGTRLTDINFQQANLVFDVAVENKNPFSIQLAGLDYDLKIGGNSLVSGITGQGIKIQESSTSTVALPVTLQFDDLRKIPGELWNKDQFAYQLDSSIRIKLPVIGDYAIPFSKKGELPVPKLPRIKLKDLRIKNLSSTAAQIIAEVVVDNPNNFDLGLSNLNYTLNINKQTWGEGLSSKPTNIPKKGKGTIIIPLELNLLNMGSAAYKVLTGDNTFNYQILGGVTLDTGMDYLRAYKMPLNIQGTATLN